jgi:Tfp pilus assembly protein PilO
MKMTKLEKKIATIILMIVMVAIVGIALQFFIYKPNTEQIDTLTNEIESLADKVEEAKKAPSLIVAYQNKINALIGGSEENSNLLNQVIDVPDTLRLIENAAASSGVEFEEISMNGNASFVKGGLIENEDGTTSEIVNAENFYLLEMKLKVICDYDQMWNFLKECEDSGFYVTVDHIAISNEKTEGPRLTGDMQINFYSLVSSDMAENASGN